MKAYPVVFAASCAAAAAVAVAALMSPTLPNAHAQVPVQAPAQSPEPSAPPMDKAHLKALYSEKCSACHELSDKYDPTVNGYTRQNWRQTVMRMMRKTDSNISPTDAENITRYLVTFAPPPGRANRAPADPWATDANDVWTVVPSATRVFNFEAPNPLAPLTPLTAGVAGPAAVWHTLPSTSPDGTVIKVALVKPTPSRFALLLDRTDQGRNLDVKVRFQIQGGVLSPAVGIAFGVSGPKTYDLLRYDALHDTLALMKFDEPTHTTLQQTPVTDPTDTTLATSANPVKLANGWHTLRLLVKDGQIRGWVDMVKRINVQDAAYSGGKVGLWTQGDTIAVFDDWTIDLYDAPAPAPAPPGTIM